MKTILIQPKDYYPTNRPMLSELFNKELVKKNFKTIWLMNRENCKDDYCMTKWNNSKTYLNCFDSYVSDINLKNFFMFYYKKLKLSLYLLKREKIDIFVSHDSVNEGFLLYLFSRYFKKPFVFVNTAPLNEIEEDYANSLQGKTKYLRKIRLFFNKILTHFLYNKAKIIHPISNEMALNFISSNNLTKCVPISESASNLFLKFKVVNKIPNSIFYHGSLSSNRRIDFLINVMKKVNAVNKKAKLFVLGWEENKGDLKKLKSYSVKKGLSDNISFLGRVSFDKVASIISRAELGVIPVPPTDFFRVSTSTKMVEYMSLGIPVVVNSEIYDQNYLIEKSKGGFSVQYNEDIFTEKILYLLDNKKKSKEMGNKGKIWISKNRSYKISADLLNDLYTSLTL